MPKGIPLTNDELKARRHEIAHDAVALILEKGFMETSVQRIAKAAGIGKSTFYDYFSTKEDVLLYLLEEIILDLIQHTAGIVTGEGAVLERMEHLLQVHLQFLLADKAYYLRLGLESQRLSVESQRSFQETRHGYLDLIRKLIEEGIETGEFRPVDSEMVVNILLSILSSVAFTAQPAGTPETMLETALEIILEGILT